jgi:hypothetical protein
MELLVATTEHNSEPSLCRLQQRQDTTRSKDSKEVEEKELEAISKDGEIETVVARQPIYSPLDPIFESLHPI